MIRAPTESVDLDLVQKFLATKGLMAKRFADHELAGGKTPDFLLFRDGAHVAYCEVKSPRDERLANTLQGAPSGVLVGFGGSDSTFNRIASVIHKAVQQFDAVNPDRKLPNVLVIVNWAAANSFRDLDEVLTGHLKLESGERYPTMLKVSEGRIREEKYRIDLYVWIDSRTKREQGFFFSQSNSAHRDAICTWLGITPGQIAA